MIGTFKNSIMSGTELDVENNIQHTGIPQLPNKHDNYPGTVLHVDTVLVFV